MTALTVFKIIGQNGKWRFGDDLIAPDTSLMSSSTDFTVLIQRYKTSKSKNCLLILKWAAIIAVICLWDAFFLED